MATDVAMPKNHPKTDVTPRHRLRDWLREERPQLVRPEGGQEFTGHDFRSLRNPGVCIFMKGAKPQRLSSELRYDTRASSEIGVQIQCESRVIPCVVCDIACADKGYYVTL